VGCADLTVAVVWWAAWLLGGALDRASAQAWNKSATLHAMRSATGLDIASGCASILAAGLAAAVVHTLTNRQRERIRARQASDTPAQIG
jgi:hypothetical protein